MLPQEYIENQARLDALFNLVKDARHWKNPIDKYIPESYDIDGIREAVIYFTGSVPTFEKTAYKQDGALVRGYRVQAAGYYAAIGA